MHLNCALHRKVIAALGVLAFVGGACSSEPTRPVAKPGQIATVLRGAPGNERAQALWDGLALDTAGALYAADFAGNRLAKIPRRGSAEPLLDEPVFPRAPNPSPGVPAGRTQRLAQLAGVAVDGAGTVFISSEGDDVVVAVTKSGQRRWVAGSGTSGNFAPPSGPASEAKLTVPAALAFDGAGNLYILTGHSVARLGRDGMVTTVAGNGQKGSGGDGGPATSAELNEPLAMTVDRAGTIYIGDRFRVRRVGADGIIKTIAGTGEEGFSGDGGPALQARFELIAGMAVDSGGNLFVSTGNRVREITADGGIRTVAGTGEKGYSGDGGPATQARLNKPNGLAVDAARNLYISDGLNSRIRTVSLAPAR